LAFLLVAALSWLFVQTKQHAANVLASATSRTVKAPPPAQGNAPASPNQEHLVGSAPVASTSPAADSKTSIILPNETLYRISVKNFGKYDEGTLARLRELNPWLNNPESIEAGQKIRIPVPAARRQQVFPRPSDSPALGTGAEKP
jgi:LysM repeat protein